MKNEELRPCDKCGSPIRQPDGLMCGATVTVQRHVMNMANTRALIGLEVMFGGHGAIALAFAPGDAVDSPRELRSDHLLCEACLLRVLAALDGATAKEA